MNLSGGSACIKYLLFIFNLIFVVTGVVVLSVGAVIQGLYHQYSYSLDDSFFSAPALLIAVGAIVFIVSFFGCCGAVKENHCMILTFSIMLLLVFILELSGGIAGYVLRDHAHDFLNYNLNESLHDFNSSAEAKEFWYLLQTSLECCGNNNYTDWKDVFPSESLPLSCCARSHDAVGADICNSTSLLMYREGCLEKFGTYVMDHAAVLGGAGIGIAFIQVLMILPLLHITSFSIYHLVILLYSTALYSGEGVVKYINMLILALNLFSLLPTCHSAGVHTFSTNLVTTIKFYGPEG